MRRARNEQSKENRKQYILDCAEKVILEQGLLSLSISKVSKKSKLAVGTIYIYFSSKEDIIAHLTIKSRTVLYQKFIDYTSKTEHPLEKIKQLLTAYYTFYKETPFYNQLVSFYESNSGLEETEELLAASRKITQLVVDILKVGKQQNLIRADVNAQEFSFLLWGTAVGIIQMIEVKSALFYKVIDKTEFEFYQTYTSMIISTLEK